MRYIGFEVGSHRVEFELDARNTYSGFAHDATIIIDGMRMHTSHCYYLNRTWEAWRFQSVCLSCCSEMIDLRIDDLRSRYKEERGLTRISGEKRKAEVKGICDSDEMIMLYRDIKKVLSERSF